jgi:cyclic pyranopterin phosphate synthase
MSDFTHFDEKGNARMVDVSDKAVTRRTATAQGKISVSRDLMDAILSKSVKKGDVLTVAQVAGIMSTRRTADLIPMAHPLGLMHANVTFEIDEEACEIKVLCTAVCEGKTGVELEALTGVSVALLTIYDMCKSVDRRMVMGDIHLIEKTGGKSGDFKF